MPNLLIENDFSPVSAATSGFGDILVVDDTPANLRLLIGLLNQHGYYARPAISGRLAISGARTVPPDLILLDIMMPELDGYEVCAQLKADERTRNIPVIFVSALDEAVDKARAFAVGGADYIPKPFHPLEVIARVDNQLRLRAAQQQLQAQNEQLQQFSQNLKELHRLSTTAYTTKSDLFADYLRSGCAMLGFTTGCVARVADHRYCIEAVYTDRADLTVGWSAPLAETYCGEVVARQQTLACAYVGQEPSLRDRAAYRELGFESYLSTPIWVNQQLYGTLGFAALEPRPQDFNASEREILELMAESLGNFIAAKQAEEQRQRAEQETQLLLSVTQAIAAAADFDSALQAALRQVCEASGWSYGEAWLPRADQQILQASAAWYARADLSPPTRQAIARFQAASLDLQFQPGESVLGRVWARGELEYIGAEAMSDEQAFLRRGLEPALRPQASLVVPITGSATTGSATAQQPARGLAVLAFFQFEEALPAPREGCGYEATACRDSPAETLREREWAVEPIAAIAAQLGTALQHKRAEAELQALLAAMDDFIAVYDRYGRCLKIAPTRVENLFCSPTEMLGRTLHEVLPPTLADRLQQHFQTAIATGQPVRLEYSVPLPNSVPECWLDACISPCMADTAVLVARDISDRKLVEQKLRSSEVELRSVFEAMNDIVLVVESDTRCIQAMPTRHAQAKPQGLAAIAATCEQLFYSEAAERYWQSVAEALSSQQTVTLEYQLSVAGQVQWFNASISPLPRQAVLWVARDISDRVCAEQALQALANQLEQRVAERTAQLREANATLRAEISDRIRAQTDLAASTEQLQAVLDAVPGFVSWLGCDPAGDGTPRYFGVNRLLAEAFHYTPEQFVGQPIGFISQGSEFTEFVREFFYSPAQAAAKVVPVQLANSLRYYLVAVQKYQGDRAAVSVGIDITARVEAEQHLQRAYQRLQLLSALTLKIRQSRDIDEILRTAVQEIRQLLAADRALVLAQQGADRSEIVQESVLPGWPLLRTREPQPAELSAYWQICQSGQPLAIADAAAENLSEAERCRLAAGQIQAKLVVPIFVHAEVWGALAIHQCSTPRSWHSDEIELLQQFADQIGIALAQAQLLDSLEERVAERTAELQIANQHLQQEIAERQRVEEALRLSEDQLRRAIDRNAYGMVVCKADGTVRFANRAAEAIFGGVPERVRAEFLQLPPPGTEACEREIARPDGPRIVEVRTVAINWEGEAAILASLMDITERKAIEQMKDEFLSVASHELRTPLTSIRGALGLLATGRLGELSVKGQRMLEIAVNNANRLGRLIDDILDLERMKSGRVQIVKQDCQAVELLTQAMEAVQSMAERASVTLQLATAPSQEPIALWADPDQMLQTLTNLLSNSIKFSKPGYSVWLAVEQRDREVLLSVCDEGRGIPADNLESIFDRFQQVDASDSREKGGTGLGLAICREIVERHGGRIWAESKLGQGSQFYITLPHRSLEAQRSVNSDLRDVVGLEPRLGER